jgi:hypothetical protein
MTNPVGPEGPALPVQPFVPGRRPKRVPKPPGPVRRFLARVPQWALAAVLCLPAWVIAGFDDAPWWVGLIGSVFLLVALLFPGAIRRGRLRQGFAMLLFLAALFAVNAAVATAVGLVRQTGFNLGLAVLEPLLGHIAFTWLLMEFLILLALGIGEAVLSRRRSWRHLLWLVPGALGAAAAALAIHEVLYQAGWILAPLNEYGFGQFKWIVPSYATLRTVALWSMVPAALRAAEGGRRRRLAMAGTATGGLAFFALLLTFIRVVPPGGFTICERTTVFIEPLNADGTINYVEALNRRYREGVTHENNAAVPLLRAIGPNGIHDIDLPVVRRRLLEELGLTDLPEEGTYFLWLKDFPEPPPAPPSSTSRPQSRPDRTTQRILASTLDPHEVLEGLTTRPWREGDPQYVTDYLERFEVPLHHFLAASQRSRFFFPLLSSDDPPSLVNAHYVSVESCLWMANAVAARAMRRVASGDVETAWAEILALHRIARLMCGGVTLVERLVGAAIEAIACRTGYALLRLGDLAGEQARRFTADLVALGPLPSIRPAMENERYLMLDAVMLLIRGMRDRRVPRWWVDWDELFRLAHLWLDVELKPGLGEREEWTRTRASRMNLWEAKARYAPRYGAPGVVASYCRGFLGGPRGLRVAATRLAGVMLTLITTVDYAEFTHDRSRAMTGLAILAMAVEAYRVENGRLPETLDALVPGYLKAMPAEHLGGKAVKYTVEGDRWELSSTGWFWGGEDTGPVRLTREGEGTDAP